MYIVYNIKYNMKSLFVKKNNNFISTNNISSYLLHLKTNKNNKISNKNYLNQNIRRGQIINLQFLINTNEINTFSLTGIIIKKSKQYNLNNSVTAKALISGSVVKYNVHLYSDALRLL
jgi:hypothetical protein